jgi:hypothetical protein
VRRAARTVLARVVAPNDAAAVRAVAAKLRSKDADVRREVVALLRELLAPPATGDGANGGWEAEGAKAAVAGVLAGGDRGARAAAYEALGAAVPREAEAAVLRTMLRELDRARDDAAESVVSVAARLLLRAAPGVAEAELAAFLAGMDREQATPPPLPFRPACRLFLL